MAADESDITSKEMLTCDPCLFTERESESTSYCPECDENLCDGCTKAHTSRSATKTHKPVSIEEKVKYIKYCDTCKDNNISKVAAKFCETCEEYLCIQCVAIHRKRKATNRHTPIELSLLKERSETVETRTCDICSLKSLSVRATTFCATCTELLCSDCTSIHLRQASTKLHKPVPLSAMPANQLLNSNKICEPCALSGNEKIAWKYCKDCGEYLCEDCGKRHCLQKLTKTHILIDASEAETKGQLCDICLKVNEANAAQSFCEKCCEALCTMCEKAHRAQRATKSHTLIPVSEMTDEEVNAENSLCDPCTNKGVSTAAKHFCTTCESYLCYECKDKHIRYKKNHDIIEAPSEKPSPEVKTQCPNDTNPATNYCLDCQNNLCESCTKMHKKQKVTRLHKIVLVDEVPQPNSEYCASCKYTDKLKVAEKYCMHCTEYLCHDCSQYHSRTKVTMEHELKDIEQFKKENRCDCDPCMFSDNKEIEAETFCKHCEEFLCAGCTRRHKAAKLSRNHTFLSVEEGRALTLENVLLCDPCKYLEKRKKAYAYCSQCKELLCDLCFKQHMAQKQTREHQLLTDLSKYNSTATSEEKVPETEPKTFKEDTFPQKTTSMDKKTELTHEENRPKDIPGKPVAQSEKADSVTLVWEVPEVCNGKHDYYQVSYKQVNREKWTFFSGEYETANVTVTDLKASTKYVFRVRVVHPNGEGKYSEESDVISTIVSPAAKLVDFSTIVRKGNPSPSVYGVPITEVGNARDGENKTRKFEVGEKRHYPSDEKTIMLVGATGTGKSTLVDGLLNYTLGVNWSDKFRFTIIDLEEEEKAKRNDQAVSQTEWITVYAINPEPGSRLNYRLNIIDTPGFGDTRGLERDQEIVDQVRALFSAKGAKGVACIDAVCFLIKAPDARLTAVQNYIFQAIMALFGKDIEHNICSLITFADGIDPPVLAALKASGLPFGKHFTFNNSGLFAKNVDLENTALSPMFWEMGLNSFNAFFKHLETMETKSLQLTKFVLDERKKLEITVQNLQPQVDAGLAKLNMMDDEIRIIKQHKLEADANKDFEYEVEELQQQRHELPKGQHTTNCLNCNYTCHKNCVYANDDEKKQCSAMGGDGNCKQCPEKCSWKQHHNTPYIFEYVTVKKKMTYEEKLQKYQDAEGKRLTHEQVVEKMSQEWGDLQDDIETLMLTVKQCNERLSEIALRPNPLSMVDHIELMIKAEKMEQKHGHMQRIDMLEDMKARALTTTRAEELTQKFRQHTETFSSKAENGGKRRSKPFSLTRFLSNLNPWRSYKK